MKGVYFGDFETTTINERGEVFVYLWVVLSGVEVYTGYDIESFIDKIKNLSGIVYFHNLPFDFSYIHYYLLEHDIPCEILEKKSILYSVKVFDIDLRDTMNFFGNMSVKDVGETYNKTYFKTLIDYNVTEGHQATDEELAYCINDCRVIEEGLNAFYENSISVLKSAGAYNTILKIEKKLTLSSIAFEAFKELSDFDLLCPKTTVTEYNSYKGAYRGGYVGSWPKGIVRNVHMIDCNSMYPYVYCTKPMPFGRGMKCQSIENCRQYNFYIVNIDIKFELKNGYIPIIGGGIGRYGGTEYYASSNGEFLNYTFCSVDLNLIEQFYDCEYYFRYGVGFETKPEFFKAYGDAFIIEKQNSRGARRIVAKRFLNSPYGKTSMNGVNEIVEYFIDPEIKAVRRVVKGFTCDDEAFQYLPIAIAITAYARELLLTTAASIGFDRVHYMDTDSIKFSGDIPTNIVIDPEILGAWKDEGTAVYFKTISPKKYVYWDKDSRKLLYTCAGFSKKVLSAEMHHNEVVDEKTALQFIDKFDSGLTLSCLQSKKVTGGRALIPVAKTIT